MTGLAVVCGAAAVALLVPARPRAPEPPTTAGRRGRRWQRLVLLAGPLVVLLLAAGASPQVAVLALAGAGVAGLASALWRRSRERAAAEQVARRVLATCEQLAGELAVGQPPARTLARAADAWPHLRPVAEAFRMGSDVPAAWRSAAALPGAGDLRHLGAAWQVAHRTGQGLGEAVDRVAHQLRGAQATRRVVRGELASARATARLVAGLPVLAMLMGSGAGGDPVGFLLGHPAGAACLAGGLLLGGAGLWWIEAIAPDVDRQG